MQQIADWLKKLGMGEYAQRFAENGIDISVLRHLTDQDLKELGISLGHRRKLMRSIGEIDDVDHFSECGRDHGDTRGSRRAPANHGDVRVAS
jgi:hypothetical protein